MLYEVITNALNLPKGQAGIFIGDLHGGTIVASIQAVVGRRVRLIRNNFV